MNKIKMLAAIVLFPVFAGAEEPNWKILPGYLRNELNIDVTTPLWTKPGNKIQKAQDIVRLMYDRMFPGRIIKGADINLSTIIGPEGIGGVTQNYHNKNNFNYRPIGSSIEDSKVVITVYDGTFATMCHELAHAYDISIRGGSFTGWSFFEEGQAVAIEMACSEDSLKQKLHYIKFSTEFMIYKSADVRWVDLRDYIGEKMGKPPGPYDYPIAGFFMSQVYSMSNPGTIKYLTSTRDPISKVYKEILRSCNMDEETFWREMDRRLMIWKGSGV